MELSKQRAQYFLGAYMARYAREGETSLECSGRIINEGIVSTEEEEIKFFDDTIRKILGKKSDVVYKRRNYGQQTFLQKVSGELYLNYGPKILSSNSN